MDAGDRIVVAVSGGGDSIALLHVLSILAPQLKVDLHAHGVDHGLRSEARSELELARGLAHRLGVEFSWSRVRVDAGGNLQARARAARYAALDEVADRCGARWVATAHHFDDRAETVLMRLLRGSPLTALGVLPACSPRRLRPFVRSPKAAVGSHLQRHRLEWAEDPSNRDARFLRTRVRHEALPLLESLSPAVRDHLNAMADEALDLNPPRVADAQGRALPLGRRHLEQIRRARKLALSGARFWLPGGVESTLSDLLETSAVATLGAGARDRPATSHAAIHGGPVDSVRKKPRPARQKPAGRGAKAHKSD